MFCWHLHINQFKQRKIAWQVVISGTEQKRMKIKNPEMLILKNRPQRCSFAIYTLYIEREIELPINSLQITCLNNFHILYNSKQVIFWIYVNFKTTLPSNSSLITANLSVLFTTDFLKFVVTKTISLERRKHQRNKTALN